MSLLFLFKEEAASSPRSYEGDFTRLSIAGTPSRVYGSFARVTSLTLDGTGSALALSGGTATLTDTANYSLTGTGSALALTGGTATLTDTRNVWLTATGSALALTGGTATLDAGGDISLVATGSALALTGGTATLTAGANVDLAATGSALALTGGTATLTATANVDLTATGSALTLTGGTATLTATDNKWLEATGSALTLTGGTAALTAGGDVALIGSGGTLALVGGTAEFDITAANEEQPSGGYAAQNYAALERQRRRRLKALEDEDEADRLEALLIAEGQLPPNPVVDARIIVREYALQADAFSRRAQRAIDYALRARTDLAYQLAAREIARQVEEEELTMLLILAAA